MAIKPPQGPKGAPAEVDAERPGPNPAPSTTPGRLTHDANYFRTAYARSLGTPAGPDFAEVLDGAPAQGRSLADLMPSSPALGHPDLPEVDLRPPPFLQPAAAMKDIYVRVKGRLSPKTTDLLEGPDLQDLLDLLRSLFETETLRNKGEARLAEPLMRILRDAPGPFLLGLNDPRLTELWRVFLDGWDIWQPEGRDEGVELFWEGEAEDDDGRDIEAVQSLTFVQGEAVLHTRLGELEDRLTFDGESFYRLRER